MSNYLSSPYAPQQPTSSVDLGLVSKTLSTLEGKYNANQAIVAQTLAAYNTKLHSLRESDNSYIAAKLGEVTNTINEYSKKNGNLAMGYNRDSILSAVTSLMDDSIIKDAVASSANKAAYDSYVEEMKQKKPELYNQANYQYGLDSGGYFDYMQGKSKKLSGMQYTPFSDYNKKLNDTILDLEKAKKDQVIEVSDGMGGIIKTTVSNLNPDQIRTVASSSLDQNDKKQLEIDAWSATNGFRDDSIKEIAKSVYKEKSDKLIIEKTDVERKIKEGGSAKQLQEWNKTLNDNITEQKNIEGITSSNRTSAIFLQREKVLNAFADKYSTIYDKKEEYVKDWNQLNYNLKVQEFELKQANFLLKKDKDIKEQTGADIQTITKPTNPEAEIGDYEKQVQDKITSVKGKIDPLLISYKSDIDQLAEQGNQPAKDLLAKYNNNLKTKLKTETDQDVFQRTVLTTVTKKSPLSIIGNKNYLSSIKTSVDEYHLYTEAASEAIKKGTLDHIKSTLDNNETFKAFYANPETTMLWYRNGKLTKAPVKDVLISKGLMDKNGNKIKDLTSDTDVLKALQRSYYANSYNSAPLKRREMVRSLAASFGEDPNSVLVDGVERSYGSVSPTTGISTGQTYKVQNINPNTATGRYLLNSQQQGMYDTFGFSDNSLTGDDTTISRFIDKDYRNSDLYRQSLKNFVDKLPENKVVSIPTTDKATYNRLASYTSSVAESEGLNFSPQNTQGINIEDKGDYVEIGQNIKSKEGITPQKIKILKTDFNQNFPNIVNKVNFNTSTAIYTYDRLKNKNIPSENVSFLDDSDTKQYEWATEVLLNTPTKKNLIPFLTQTDSRNTLISSNASLIKRTPEVSGLIDKALKESSNYSINMEVSEGFTGPKLHLKLVDTSNGKVIHTMTQSGVTDLDNFKEILDNAPQIYYSTIIDDILKKQAYSQQSGSINDSFTKLVESLKN